MDDVRCPQLKRKIIYYSFFTANLLVHMDGLWLTNLLITLFTSAPFLGAALCLSLSFSLNPSLPLTQSH